MGEAAFGHPASVFYEAKLFVHYLFLVEMNHGNQSSSVLLPEQRPLSLDTMVQEVFRADSLKFLQPKLDVVHQKLGAAKKPSESLGPNVACCPKSVDLLPS